MHPQSRKQRWLLSDSETIFEDIYIIRQVVQESESSISMRVPSIEMTLGYDEETESGQRILRTISTTKSLILAQDER